MVTGHLRMEQIPHGPFRRRNKGSVWLGDECEGAWGEPSVVSLQTERVGSSGTPRSGVQKPVGKRCCFAGPGCRGAALSLPPHREPLSVLTRVPADPAAGGGPPSHRLIFSVVITLCWISAF